jgi:hypothetical protein
MGDSDRVPKWEDGKSETYTYAISFPLSSVRFVGNLTTPGGQTKNKRHISHAPKGIAERRKSTYIARVSKDLPTRHTNISGGEK